MARSKDHPLFSLWRKVCSLMPARSAHSAKHRVSPLNSTKRVRDVLRACSDGVAHRQLSGVYPPVLSIRSMEYSPGGRGPMSARNLSNDSRQRSHTKIPRAPYLRNPAELGLWQRCIIRLQVSYSRVFDSPWVCDVLPMEAFSSLIRHPQDTVLPDTRLAAPISSTVPQSHRHVIFALLPDRLTRATDTSRPKRLPSIDPTVCNSSVDVCSVLQIITAYNGIGVFL